MKQLVDLLGSLLTKISHEEENIFIIDNILTIPHYLLRTCPHSKYNMIVEYNFINDLKNELIYVLNFKIVKTKVS